MPLFGANKTANTQRLVNGTYTAFLSGLKLRYEPIPKRTNRGYITREEHCSFQVMVHPVDIKMSDRILVDGRMFVVSGVATLDEAMGKHLEPVMREIGSSFHETVTKKVLSVTQPAYDPHFREYAVAGKSYTDVSMSVLMDQALNAKERYKMLLDAGKFNDIEYLMSVDIPDELTTDDRIIYKNRTYKVSWVEDLLWMKMAGLKTDVDNMPTNL